MTQAAVAAELTNDAILYALLASLAFLVSYLLLARGWRTPVGRTLILLDLGLVLLYLPAALHRFFGLGVASIGFAWYYAATIALVGTAVWWRTVIMFRAQRRGRPDS
jgi:hypothetical protein